MSSILLATIIFRSWWLCHCQTLAGKHTIFPLHRNSKSNYINVYTQAATDNHSLPLVTNTFLQQLRIHYMYLSLSSSVFSGWVLSDTVWASLVFERYPLIVLSPTLGFELNEATLGWWLYSNDIISGSSSSEVSRVVHRQLVSGFLRSAEYTDQGVGKSGLCFRSLAVSAPPDNELKFTLPLGCWLLEHPE